MLFEHAPARGHPAFTGDRTAFDVLIRGRTPTGQRAFCTFEMKYSEDLRESAPPIIHECYGHIAPFFNINPEEPTLRTPPPQQLFRIHSLAQCMLDRDLTDMGVFLFVPPRLNTPPQAAAGAYRCHLLEPGRGQVPFLPITLERLFEAIFAAGERELAHQLHRRYTDFWLLDGEIALALVDQTNPASSASAEQDAGTARQHLTAPPGRGASPSSAA